MTFVAQTGHLTPVKQRAHLAGGFTDTLPGFDEVRVTSLQERHCPPCTLLEFCIIIKPLLGGFVHALHNSSIARALWQSYQAEVRL